MRVHMKADISGTRDGENWPPRGGVLNVSDDEGAQLCRAGLATPAAAADVVETAVAPSADVEERYDKPEPTRPDPSLAESTRVALVPAKRRPGRPRKNQA